MAHAIETSLAVAGVDEVTIYGFTTLMWPRSGILVDEIVIEHGKRAKNHRFLGRKPKNPYCGTRSRTCWQKNREARALLPAATTVRTLFSKHESKRTNGYLRRFPLHR